MYMPRNREDSKLILERKRDEYWNLVDRYFDQRFEPMYKEDFRQISIDCPRMNPQIKALHNPVIQEMFQRILFLWAVKHPASGYVQGMNDLIVSFFIVFMSDFIDENCEIEQFGNIMACNDKRCKCYAEMEEVNTFERSVTEANYRFHRKN
ncbi:hypothetical protein GJ496_006013 [Pomphorhynchus laevis]|nr:hypothetical protein GJ496_006013 [Pomphorhynchus laevis]